MITYLINNLLTNAKKVLVFILSNQAFKILNSIASLFHPRNQQRIDISVDLLAGLHFKPLAISNTLIRRQFIQLTLNLLFNQIGLLLNLLVNSPVVNIRIYNKLHQSASLVVLQKPSVNYGVNSDLLIKALLLEIAQGQIIGAGHHHKHIPALQLSLQLAHQQGTMALNLVLGTNSQKYHLSQLCLWKHPVANPSKYFLFMFNSQTVVLLVKEKSHYVLLGHFGKLLGEDDLQVNKLLHLFPGLIVINVLKRNMFPSLH